MEIPYVNIYPHKIVRVSFSKFTIQIVSLAVPGPM